MFNWLSRMIFLQFSVVPVWSLEGITVASARFSTILDPSVFFIRLTNYFRKLVTLISILVFLQHASSCHTLASVKC